MSSVFTWSRFQADILMTSDDPHPETQLCIPNCDGSHHRKLAPFAPSTAFDRLPVGRLWFFEAGGTWSQAKHASFIPTSARDDFSARQMKRNHETLGWQRHGIQKEVLRTKFKNQIWSNIKSSCFTWNEVVFSCFIMFYLDFPILRTWRNIHNITILSDVARQSCTKSWGHGHSKQCQWHRAMYRRCEPWEAIFLPEGDLNEWPRFGICLQ